MQPQIGETWVNLKSRHPVRIVQHDHTIRATKKGFAIVCPSGSAVCAADIPAKCAIVVFRRGDSLLAMNADDFVWRYQKTDHMARSVKR